MESDNTFTVSKDIVALDEEPLAGVAVEGMKAKADHINSVRELAAVYATVDNQAWCIEDDIYDFEEGTGERKNAEVRVDAWMKLSNELEERIVRQARKEKLLREKQPNSGLVRQLEPFMEKYGYRNANGWWIEIDED